MSINDFSNNLRSRALKSWFTKLSTDNLLKISVNSKQNDFYITKSTISDIIERLSNANATPEKIDAVFNKLTRLPYNVENKLAQVITEASVSGNILFFPDIDISDIYGLLDSAFYEVLQDAKANNPGIKLHDYFEPGEVFSSFSTSISESKDQIKNSVLSNTSKSNLVSYLNDIEKQLRKLDRQTANIKTPEFTLYARYNKNPSRSLIELKVVGSEVIASNPLQLAIRKYFNSANVIFKTRGKLEFTNAEARQKISDLIEDNIESILDSDPSYSDLVLGAIAEQIDGKKRKTTNSIPFIPIIKSTGAKVDTKALSKSIKKSTSNIKKLKESVKAVPKFESKSETSLFSLLDYIRQHINSQVAKNMGDGFRRDILNYRTGRFADSVEVNRLTISRNGMITAFYNYMRYPYATFEPGNKQGSPLTRNPRLLIAKSIREIAAEKVSNSIQSVLGK